MELIKFNVLTFEEYNTLVRRIERIERVLGLGSYVSPLDGKVSYEGYEIDSLDLDVRERNCLIFRGNIATIKQLLELDLTGLQGIRTIGKKSIRKITQKLRDKGYTQTLPKDHWANTQEGWPPEGWDEV